MDVVDAIGASPDTGLKDVFQTALECLVRTLDLYGWAPPPQGSRLQKLVRYALVVSNEIAGIRQAFLQEGRAAYRHTNCNTAGATCIPQIVFRRLATVQAGWCGNQLQRRQGLHCHPPHTARRCACLLQSFTFRRPLRGCVLPLLKNAYSICLRQMPSSSRSLPVSPRAGRRAQLRLRAKRRLSRHQKLCASHGPAIPAPAGRPAG